MKPYDIAVIGGGPGGYVAAIRAAQAGASVCLIEEDRVGGTCLNRGCIPTKALVSTARLLRQFKGAASHGIEVVPPRFDFVQAMQRKDGVVDKLVGGVEQLLKGNGVDLFRGRGTLEGEGRIKIQAREGVMRLQSRSIILATGSRPARPKTLLVDGKNILTSREILAIKDLPERLLIIGGGYIGSEFAAIFATFGCSVTLVEQLPSLLAQSDKQVVREVEKGMKESGVRVLVKTAVESLESMDETVKVRLSGGEELEVDKVLVAVGRIPYTVGLGLDTVGVKLEKGAVVVDEHMRTSVPGVYAIGDVTNIIQLAHVASYQAGIAVTNALGGDAAADYRVVPSAIFTYPEVGQVGLREEEVKASGVPYEVGRFSFQALSKALCDDETLGVAKIVAEKGSGKLLGATIAGEEASALIAEVAAAMQKGMSAAELGEVIHAHPTLSEVIKEAAEDLEGLAVHKVGRRRK